MCALSSESTVEIRMCCQLFQRLINFPLLPPAAAPAVAQYYSDSVCVCGACVCVVCVCGARVVRVCVCCVRVCGVCVWRGVLLSKT